MANIGPTIWYASSVGWTAVTAWPSNTAKAAGTTVRQNTAPTVGNERVFVAVVGGTTTTGTEPTWVVTKGAKTTDNTITWQECTGQPGVNGDTTNCPTWLQNKNNAITIGMIITDAAVDTLFICTTAGTTGNGAEPTWNKTAGVTTTDNTAVWTSIGAVGNFGKFAAPHARLANSVAASWAANGNTVYAADNHAETQAAALALTAGTAPLPISFYCIDHLGSIPPTSSNLKTSATVTTTGNNSISIGAASGSGLYINGIQFSSGSGANAVAFNFTTTQTFAANLLIFENCSLIKAATTAANFVFGGLVATKVRLINTTFQFGATGDHITVNGCDFLWRNTPSAISGATHPTTLFSLTSNDGAGFLRVDGVDLSALTGTLISNTAQCTRTLFTDCNLNSAATPMTAPSMPAAESSFVRCSSSGNDYDIKQYNYEGTMLSDTTVTRTGGATDGTTSTSYKATTTANASYINPFEMIPISIWSSVTAANVTITMYGVANTASMPTDAQVGFDVDYLGSSSSPLASFASTRAINGLAAGSNLTADTSAWDSSATARANTTAYVVGNVISVASNPGRIFFCTVSGTSAGSEPGGYSSAVDGGTVTDNTATFRAGWRFTDSVVLSSPQPQIAGYLRVIPKLTVASTTIYVDPLPVLS